MNEAWKSLAVCRRTLQDHPNGQELFFSPLMESEAKAYCRVCPVDGECLDYGIANDIVEGIWGGMNFKERRREVRRRKKEEG